MGTCYQFSVINTHCMFYQLPHGHGWEEVIPVMPN
jgi:hypothetical protein